MLFVIEGDSIGLSSLDNSLYILEVFPDELMDSRVLRNNLVGSIR